jgi:hypothetical protein
MCIGSGVGFSWCVVQNQLIRWLQETYAQAADAAAVRIAGLEAELEQTRAHASSTSTQLAASMVGLARAGSRDWAPLNAPCIHCCAEEQQVQSLRAELERDSSNLSAQTTALRYASVGVLEAPACVWAVGRAGW